MTEYTNANGQESAALAGQATSYFENGVDARETGDMYVKIAVFLATVLLLTALSQRFQLFGPRVAVVAVTGINLVISTYWFLTFPQA